MALYALTVVTATRPEFAFLLTSASKHGITPIMLGMGNPRLSYLQRDYSLKIELVQDWIRKNLATGAVKPQDLVVVTDAYDVVMIGGPSEIIGGWKAAGAPPILLSAERNLWPLKNLKDQFDQAAVKYGNSSPYRYINSGTYMGTAAALLAFLDTIPFKGDDQAMLQTAWSNHGHAMGAAIDYHRRVFYVPVLDDMELIKRNTTPIMHFAGADNFALMGKYFKYKFPEALQPQYNPMYWARQKAAAFDDGDDPYRSATIGLGVSTGALLVICIVLAILVAASSRR